MLIVYLELNWKQLLNWDRNFSGTRMRPSLLDFIYSIHSFIYLFDSCSYFSQSIQVVSIMMPRSACTVLVLLAVIFGIIPQRVFSFGECKNETKSVCSSVSATCPSCLKILWPESLTRSPYVQKIDKSTNGGLLFGKFFFSFLSLF